MSLFDHFAQQCVAIIYSQAVVLDGEQQNAQRAG